MLLPLLVVSATVSPAWRASVGAQVDGDPHAAVSVAARWGGWRAQLDTDTLELRYGEETSTDRFSVGVRGELFASGLMISPWTAGDKDPARALFAHHGGLDAEYAYYLPLGFYLALGASGRVYAFGAQSQTVGPAPGPELVAGPTLTLGWWSASAALALEGGFDVLAASALEVSPRASAQLRVEPAWAWGPVELGPWIEGRAAVAAHQDRTTLTRIGGLSPYVVPLAGAAWAEWWAEDYLAVRAGARVQSTHVWVAVVVDAAWMTTPLVTPDALGAWGIGALTGLRFKPFFATVAGGWAPRILRQDGVPRASLWLTLGTDWTEF